MAEHKKRPNRPPRARFDAEVVRHAQAAADAIAIARRARGRGWRQPPAPSVAGGENLTSR